MVAMTPRAARLVGAGALAVLSISACGSLTLGGEPEEMSVEIEAVGANSVTIITSTDWVFVPDPGCNPNEQQCEEVLRVNAADTAQAAVPFRRTYRFTDTFRYLVETYPTGDVAATLNLKVAIDGKSWYNDSRALAAPPAQGDRETLLFTYAWREPRIR